MRAVPSHPCGQMEVPGSQLWAGSPAGLGRSWLDLPDDSMPLASPYVTGAQSLQTLRCASQTHPFPKASCRLPVDMRWGASLEAVGISSSLFY